MSLYNIKTELAELLDAMTTDGAFDAETEAALAEHAQALVEAFDAKADAYAALIRVAETRAAARREEVERMKRLVADDEALADRLKRMLMDAMTATGKTKVETERFRLSVKKNGGKIPVIITDEAALPVDFKVPKVTEVIDKDGIREALESGNQVPGAALGERGQRLEIK
jgi:hypothetical protein